MKKKKKKKNKYENRKVIHVRKRTIQEMMRKILQKKNKILRTEVKVHSLKKRLVSDMESETLIEFPLSRNNFKFRDNKAIRSPQD